MFFLPFSLWSRRFHSGFPFHHLITSQWVLNENFPAINHHHWRQLKFISSKAESVLMTEHLNRRRRGFFFGSGRSFPWLSVLYALNIGKKLFREYFRWTLIKILWHIYSGGKRILIKFSQQFVNTVNSKAPDHKFRFMMAH